MPSILQKQQQEREQHDAEDEERGEEPEPENFKTTIDQIHSNIEITNNSYSSNMFNKSTKELALLNELINSEKTNLRDLQIITLNFKQFLDQKNQEYQEENDQNNSKFLSDWPILTSFLAIYSQFYIIHENFLARLENCLTEFEEEVSTAAALE